MQSNGAFQLGRRKPQSEVLHLRSKERDSSNPGPLES